MYLCYCGRRPPFGRLRVSGRFPFPDAWTHNVKEYAVTVGGTGAGNRTAGAPKLVDPASGNVHWEHPVPDPGKSLSIRDDVALIFSGVSAAAGADEDDDKKPAAPNSPPGNGAGPVKCLAIRLSPDKPEPLWAVPCPWASVHCDPVASAKGHVLLSGPLESRLVDLRTGKELAAWKGKGGGNEGHADVVEDRFLIAHDGSHGDQSLSMLLDSVETFSATGTGPCALQHGQTTGYHNRPMTRAIADGRLFIRGFDGIYCYDLRARP
jgi:outer membrane protein assembly factor BamB